MALEYIGSLFFGLVVGYITYRVLARTTDRAAVTDLAAVVGAVGGGAVTGLFDPGSGMFAMYAIGLAAGMIAYAVLFGWLNGRTELAKVLGGSDPERPL